MSGFFLDGSWQLMVFIAALCGFATVLMLASTISSLLRARFESQVGSALRDQFVTVDADRLWWFSCVVAALIAVSIALISGHWWAGVAAGALALLLPRAALMRIRSRQLERFRSQLPDFLILLSGSLRAGSGLSLALSRSAAASPAPLRPQIEKVLADLRLGVSLTEAFASLERRTPLEEVWGIGPRRIDPSPIRAGDVGYPHVVLLSHNHYDHLDRRTLFALPGRTAARAIVPEGLGAYARAIGFAHVTELPWGAAIDVGAVKVTSVPAVHFSGRGLFDRNRSHWNGYLMDSGRRRVFFAGDTAYSSALGSAASAGGACDLALVPIGAYMPAEIMSPVHSTPEEAVQIGRDARASRIVAMHWGTIPLSTEPTFEPPLRFASAAARAGFRDDEVLAPAIGASIFLKG